MKQEKQHKKAEEVLIKDAPLKSKEEKQRHSENNSDSNIELSEFDLALRKIMGFGVKK